jgi:hypothetical protein
MSEKEEKVESKEAPHLVNMELSTILSMVNRLSKEYKDAEDKASDLASALPDKELFNLFFALEFLFRSDEGRKSQKDLEDESNSLFLHAVIINEVEIRTGLPYDLGSNFLTTL